MARKGSSNFDVFDTSLEVQPPKGSAETDINYGGVADADEAHDPMGVMPDAPQKNIGPKS